MTNKAAGPFTAGDCVVHSDDGTTIDGTAVFDAEGQPFCLVADDDAVGGHPGAKARATRIAESLNKTEDHSISDETVDVACAALLEALKPAMMTKFGDDAADYQKTWADATEDERAMFMPAMRAALEAVR